jgi:hypothetical protein
MGCRALAHPEDKYKDDLFYWPNMNSAIDHSKKQNDFHIEKTKNIEPFDLYLRLKTDSNRHEVQKKSCLH